MSTKTKISVIVPVYNEEKTILTTLAKVHEQRSKLDRIEMEVVVIDDGSKDNTVAELKTREDLYNQLVIQPKNGGKGAAVCAGLRVATGEFVLFQDADLEYDPDDYSKIFAPVLDHQADVVYGSRFLAPTQTRVAYFWHKVGNRIITLLFNIMNNTTFTDIYSCYLMYRRSLIDPDELKTFGWEQQAEILTLATRRGKVYYEVPISYFGRSYEEGKKIRAHHIISVIKTIILKRLFYPLLYKREVLRV